MGRWFIEVVSDPRHRRQQQDEQHHRNEVRARNSSHLQTDLDGSDDEEENNLQPELKEPLSEKEIEGTIDGILSK